MLAGLGLISIPIIIHLLHRLRYRRVRFAAMEFLRESQRQNRRRIWWEQLLLLLLRCAVVCLIVLAIARPQTTGWLASMLGTGGTSDHWIIWDDSASMGQQTGGSSPYELAKERIGQLLEELRRQPGRQQVTLLRTTQPTAPLIEQAIVDDKLVRSTRALIDSQSVSWLASSPALALQFAADQITAGRPASVHLFTDFTSKDWQENPPIQNSVKSLNDKLARLRFVDLAPSSTAAGPTNLGIVDLSIDRSPPPVGVPLEVTAKIRNFSTRTISRLIATPKWNGQTLPARVVESLAPGETQSLAIELISSSPGLHQLSLRIDSDSLAADDERVVVIDTPQSVPVLIIDDSPGRRESLYLSLALAPGGDAVTGVSPDVRTSSEAMTLDLQTYRSIFLINLPRISREWASKLRSFVASGGGLAIFVGDQVDASKYNDILLPPAIGLLPAPLAARTTRANPSTLATDQPGDLRPLDHPVFKTFADQRNSFLQTVLVDQYLSIDDQSLPSNARTILRHRDGSPLWIESAIEKGHVLLSLTTAGDTWNSWPQNPSFVVGMLRLQDYLSSAVVIDQSALCGEPWSLQWNLADFRADAQLFPPSPFDTTGQSIRAAVDGNQASIHLDDLTTPGVYQLIRTRSDSTTQTMARAYNIDPKEGDLTKITLPQLKQTLGNIDFEYIPQNDESSLRGPRSFEAKDALLALLLAVLLIEQFLSYRLGYHRSDSA
jgi:hypothetical protein